MKRIRLVRTDLPQELDVFLDLEESTCEVIIGRGTLLKCSDKRVSRSHCSLRLLPDGGILLVARHTNPCFYKVQSQSAIFTSLLRNESITLYKGDEFSLLPESFQYRYLMIDEQNCAGNPDDMEPTTNTLDTTGNCVVNSDEVDNRHLDAMNATSPGTVGTALTGESPPTRALPDWLINLPPSNVIVPLTKARKRKLEQQKYLMDKKQKNAYNETCRANTNVSADQLSSSQRTESNENLSVMDTEATETGLPSIFSLPQMATEMPANDQQTQSNRKEGFEENWGDLTRVKVEPGVATQVDKKTAENPVSIKKEQNEERPGNSGLARVKIEPGIETQADNKPGENPAVSTNKQIKVEPVEEEPVDGTSNPAGVDPGASCSNTAAPAAAANAREMCIYGSGCYRRNPQHRADLSHPGDPDYDAEAGNLPECQYGTSCYRKNVQHRRDFKHTKTMSPPPQPQPRQRPPQTNNTARLGDTSEEDEYDLNDSFLNDASSDDYQPSGSSETDDDSEEVNSSQLDSQLTPEKKKKRKLRKRK